MDVSWHPALAHVPVHYEEEVMLLTTITAFPHHYYYILSDGAAKVCVRHERHRCVTAVPSQIAITVAL